MREDSNCAVFVNGFLQEIRGDGAITRIQACEWIGDIAGYADDPFVSLNTAFMNIRGGAYAQFDPGRRNEAPLHLIYVTTESDSRDR